MVVSGWWLEHVVPSPDAMNQNQVEWGWRPTRAPLFFPVNQTEEGQVAFPPAHPTHTHTHPASRREWAAFLAGSYWPSELREDVCPFN